jgi:hypothetical protein
MTRFVITVFAVITLAQPALSVAGDYPTDPAAKTSSFVPHPRTNHHVYGAPIGPAIVHRRKTAHHEHSPKKPASKIADRPTR